MIDLSSIKIPEGYIPFERIILCSNILINTKFIFLLDGDVPFFIGKGEVPQIWLKSFNGDQWQLLLKQNEPQHDLISTVAYDNSITVNAAQSRILNATIEDGECIISFLDFRYIGINIFGNRDALFALGNNKFARNTMENLGVFMGFNSKQFMQKVSS